MLMMASLNILTGIIDMKILTGIIHMYDDYNHDYDDDHQCLMTVVAATKLTCFLSVDRG